MRFGAVAMAVITILWSGPVLAEGEKPQPTTTANPEVPVKELELLVRPLTKDDLKVEANGWLGVLKEHVTQVGRNKIEAMKADGDAKAKLLSDATQLQERQTALIDRVQAVVEELRKKGGEADVYDKYLKTVSGIKVDATDAQGSWKLVAGWLTSAEGGLRWVRNILMFILTIVAFKVLAAIVGTAIRKAVSKIGGASELLKDFIVNSIRKVTLVVGLVIALSMLEVNIGPFLAAIGATGFILGFALQGTLSNFAAGLMILLYRPYDIGDSVNVAGTSGTVSAMSLVSTTLCADNQVITIPNSSIWGGIITKGSAPKTEIDQSLRIEPNIRPTKIEAETRRSPARLAALPTVRVQRRTTKGSRKPGPRPCAIISSNKASRRSTSGPRGSARPIRWRPTIHWRGVQ
ncbi:MAG: mechanosensitive ion channel family protein [Desulfobacterales bacterium]|nr:mechanosensitive ion channel family protein [Desulfobacterales bacterium]